MIRDGSVTSGRAALLVIPKVGATSRNLFRSETVPTIRMARSGSDRMKELDASVRRFFQCRQTGGFFRYFAYTSRKSTELFFITEH